MFSYFRKRRREKIKTQPFPVEWREIVKNNVPYTSLLTAEESAELEDHIQVFLAEKTFEGFEGIEITDEIRVTIAAQACLLLLHRETDYYPNMQSILVYPHHYFAPIKHYNPDGTVTETFENRLGESWHMGEVVLSWDDVKHGAADIRDGHNVVLHEFAHQLDGENGSVDGAPPLAKRSMYSAWARVLSKEYLQLLDDLEHHRRNCLRNYAATNPAEFFAVVTEMFFEQPEKLSRCHPELYEQLKGFYRQDPLQRIKENSDRRQLN